MYAKLTKSPYYQGYKTASKIAGAYQAGMLGARLAYRGGRYIRRKFGAKKVNVRVPKRAMRARPKKTLKAVAKEVNNLKKKVSTLNTIYIKKYRSYGSLTASTNQTNYAVTTLNSASVINGVIDSVKYFNPSAPSTLINVDLTAPTYQQKVSITKSYMRLTIRNNFSVPCFVDVYFVKCKKDTSIDPDTAISNALADMSNASLTASQVFPTDCHDFNDLWKIVKHKRYLMNPGKTVIFTGSCPSFDYDVSLSDSQTESYLRYMHGSQIMVRVEGMIAHGLASGVGNMQCGVDYELRRHHTVEYSGGVATQYIEVEDNTQVISGTHQCSQPDSEQAAYAR